MKIKSVNFLMQKKKRHGAIALLEFDSIASGVLASDLMLKRSPIALLRCGSIHPGRFLILVGGSVASTQEAYAAGVQLGESKGSLNANIFLGDVHPSLHDAVLGERRDLAGDALAVVETHTSPMLLAAVDAAIKSNIAQLPPDYFNEVDRVVAKLAERLAQQHRARRRRAQRGTLDLKRTLRDNIAYDGALFQLRWRRKKKQKSAIYVVCDVSNSVAAMAR